MTFLLKISDCFFLSTYIVSATEKARKRQNKDMVLINTLVFLPENYGNLLNMWYKGMLIGLLRNKAKQDGTFLIFLFRCKISS